MPEVIVNILAYAYAYNIIVKAILASTSTPPTNTFWGKLYKALEWSVLVIGKVKEGASDK